MTIIIFLLVLSVLVLVHEAGHYFAARFFNVHAEEFGFGFPPRLFGFVKVNGKWKRVNSRDRGPYEKTIWSINWLPLGGFVRLKGEVADGVDDPNSFNKKPVWQRLVILAAGVIMNWVLATVLLFAVYTIGSDTILHDLPAGAEVKNERVVVSAIAETSPAAEVGLPPGSEIVSINGVRPESSEVAQQLIADQREDEFSITLRKDGVEETYGVRAEYLPEYEKVAVGVALADVGEVSFPPLQAATAAVSSVWHYSKAVAFTLADVVRGLIAREPVADGLAGPVGIAVISGEVAKQGIIPLLEFMAILSINLAVLNILPIPALDGGRVVFLAIEKIRKRPMSRNVEAVIHNVAFFILIGLLLLITAVDLSRLGS